MDPNDLTSFNHKTLDLANNRKYHIIDQLPSGYGKATNHTLLLIHGFPDYWAGWKHQIGPWVNAGYRVVVPDMLGYGQTSKPLDPDEYSSKKISSELAGILNKIGVNEVVVIGHDWGSHIAGRFALWHPDKVIGVVHISIGFFPPNVPCRSHEESVGGTEYEYQLYFKSHECIEEIKGNSRDFFNYAFHTDIFSGPQGIPSNFGKVFKGKKPPTRGQFLLSERELDEIVHNNDNPHAMTNYYRAWTIRCEEEVELSGRTYKKNMPVLFLRGDEDKTSTSYQVAQTEVSSTRVNVISYQGVAHWVMLEKKEKVANDVLTWLESVGYVRLPRSKC